MSHITISQDPYHKENNLIHLTIAHLIGIQDCAESLCQKNVRILITREKDQGSPRSLFAFGWQMVLIGYATGMIIGVALGNMCITGKFEWFVKIFGLPRKRMEKRRE